MITLLSAFYHYGLTDVIPEVCDLATGRNAAKIHDTRVRQVFVPDAILYKEVLLNYRKILPQLNIQDIQDYAMAAPKRKMIMEALQMEVL